MGGSSIQSHAYAVRAAGFTRIEAQVDRSWLDELRALTDRALAAARAVFRAKGKLNSTAFSDDYEASRCFYCWGDAALRLLDLDVIHAIAQHVIGDGYRLWDVSVLSVASAANRGERESAFAAGDYHRDRHPVDTRVGKPPFLWCFVCLDDVTPRNGATWVVPGSHHVPTPAGLEMGSVPLSSFARPISVQACAAAGDLIVLNPTALHSAGQNLTDKPRRLINVGLCSPGTPPLLDHWAIAGATIHQRVSPRVREMLRSDAEAGLEKTWDALPEGWPL
jgi:hypothetical protein